MTRSSKAIYACADWMSYCLKIGWRQSDLDDLQRLWWQWHDDDGKLIDRTDKHGEKIMSATAIEETEMMRGLRDIERSLSEYHRIKPAIYGVAAFLRGEDDSEGLPDCFDKLADFEPVTITLNARTIRAVLAATEPR
jgi:hypothetical protein